MIFNISSKIAHAFIVSLFLMILEYSVRGRDKVPTLSLEKPLPYQRCP